MKLKNPSGHCGELLQWFKQADRMASGQVVSASGTHGHQADADVTGDSLVIVV